MFRLNVLATAHGISSAGDSLFLVALLLVLQEQGASSFLVSALVLVNLLPTVVLAPILAPLLDKVETTRLLTVTLAVRALLGIGIAFVPDTGLLLVLVTLAATISTIDSPAMTLLIPVAVPGESAASVGFARADAFRSIGALVGPAAAGLLVGTIGPHLTLLIDAATFVILLVTIKLLRLQRPPLRQQSEGRSWWNQVRSGPQALAGDRVIAASVATLAGAIVFTSLITVAQVFFIREALGQPSTVFGFIITAGALGRIVAATVVAPRVPADRQTHALWLGGVLMGVSLIGTATWQVLPVAFVGFFLVGVANSVQSIAIRGILYDRAPQTVHGRAFTAMFALNNASTMVGTAAGGPAVALLGSVGALAVSGGGTLIVTIAAIASSWKRPGRASN